MLKVVSPVDRLRFATALHFEAHPVRSKSLKPPVTVVDQAGRNVAQAVVPSHQREYLGSSVSIYSHVKIKLEIASASRSAFQASLVQPPGKGPARYAITAKGVADVY